MWKKIKTKFYKRSQKYLINGKWYKNIKEIRKDVRKDKGGFFILNAVCVWNIYFVVEKNKKQQLFNIKTGERFVLPDGTAEFDSTYEGEDYLFVVVRGVKTYFNPKTLKKINN